MNLTVKQLKQIHNIYDSDVRSMINFMQANQYFLNKNRMLDSIAINKIIKKIKDFNKFDTNKILSYVNKQCLNYNINHSMLVKKLVNYIIENYEINCNFLKQIEFLNHSMNDNENNEQVYSFIVIMNFVKINDPVEK